jgi:septal ring factor EnvC (AmiA/AmiB activator)
LHDVGSKLTEASRIKEELERETSNLRRDHRNLLEELERAQIKSKELSSQLDKLGKELKTKSD